MNVSDRILAFARTRPQGFTCQSASTVLSIPLSTTRSTCSKLKADGELTTNDPTGSTKTYKIAEQRIKQDRQTQIIQADAIIGESRARLEQLRAPVERELRNPEDPIIDKVMENNIIRALGLDRNQVRLHLIKLGAKSLGL